jgi:hypothetical protein
VQFARLVDEGGPVEDVNRERLFDGNRRLDASLRFLHDAVSWPFGPVAQKPFGRLHRLNF